MVVTLRTSQPSLSIITEMMALYGLSSPVNLIRLLAQFLQFFLALARGGFGNFTVVLGVNDQHGVFQVRVMPLKILGHVVAVAGVVGHHEQDGLLAHLFVLGIRLAPFDHAQMDIVGVFLGVLGALALLQFRAAGGVGQHRMLDDVLRDGLHQRVIGHGLHEDRAVVVLGRGGHVHLHGKSRALSASGGCECLRWI